MNIKLDSKVYLAGHTGMVGSSILRTLKNRGYSDIIVIDSKTLNLTNQTAVFDFFSKSKPDIVILAAAKVGGIQANIDNPATFLLDNLQIQNNIIEASFKNGVKKLVFLGSSCIYPRESPQPMKEEYLLTGKLEPTNEGYAIAKIAGIKLLEGMYKQYGFSSISLMPCNLYGPNDSFDLKHSHVLSSLVKRFTDAVQGNLESVTLWGTGIARREFMHVDDLSSAVVFMIENYNSPDFINIGWGDDISIKELAIRIAQKTGYKGQILWDASKPEGMLRKCMDVSIMKEMGFSPNIKLDDGIEQMINLYKQSKNSIV